MTNALCGSSVLKSLVCCVFVTENCTCEVTFAPAVHKSFRQRALKRLAARIAVDLGNLNCCGSCCSALAGGEAAK